MNDAYVADYPCALGRLVGNLSSLEWILRNVLYRLEHPPHAALPNGVSLFTAKPDDRLPLNALTSWDTLEKLIEKFNRQNETFRIDPTLKTLRDAFAHGRLLFGDESWQQLVLMKFLPPEKTDGMVGVEARYELTLDWMNEQIV